MRHFLAVILFLIAIQGCSNREEAAANLGAFKFRATPAAADAIAQRQYLAIQNSISVEVDAQRVASLYEAGQHACREASVDDCLVLESHISTGPLTTASLKFRAKASGIRKLISTFTANGTIKSQSTTAEDLSAPIADTAKKLAMLGDYRSKLEGLLERASTDVDALIKVNRELAHVQSELESMTGTQSNLMRRVETEILFVSISSLDSQSSWKLVTSAFSEFGANLARGISSAITGIAYVAPWTLTLVFVIWAGYKIRRRQRRTNRGA